MSLTEKQELFAQSVANGARQSEAYRAHYETSRMSDKCVWEEASKLASAPKVAQRIAELKAELAEKHLWTREMSVKALVTAYSIAKTQKQSTAMTAAVKELNNMHGFNEPQKIDLMNTDGSLRPQAIDATKLSTETLKELMAARNDSSDSTD